VPKRNDIHKVLIIGSGPVIIGQAGEYDDAAIQACKALRSLGCQTVLVNSNPASVMTDPGVADAAYIEPLNLAYCEQIIAKEKPDALLPVFGGRTGINLAFQLADAGILEKHGVRLIGADIDAIHRSVDLAAFREILNKLGIDAPAGRVVHSEAEAEKAAEELGYPVAIRPAYATGSAGSGLVYNVEELRSAASRGLSESMVRRVLIEESFWGWEELELEVIRDSGNRMITVCFIENVDAAGVHPGDSIRTTPMQTIDPGLRGKLQKYAYDIAESVGIVGCAGIRFAHDPKTGRVAAVKINPRFSRSSAFATRAGGFPVANVSTLLACGLTLDEIPWRKKETLEKYEPLGDSVAVMFPRWAFEKFEGIEDRLGVRMSAVGEAMAVGKTFKEALQKAVRSLEIGRSGLGFVKDFHGKPLDELMKLLSAPSSERCFLMYEALRQGASVEDMHRKTFINSWFIGQMKELTELEEEILKRGNGNLPDDLLIRAKKDGFADQYMAMLLSIREEDIRGRRTALGTQPGWQYVSDIENSTSCFSTFNAPDIVKTGDRKKIMVLGSGPNRIGQGGEFDYGCVRALSAIREAGYESVMVNCNPGAVSAGIGVADKLYFSPLTIEDVLAVWEKEKPVGMIVQFGGQTAIEIADGLEKAGVKIIGTPLEAVGLAEDRGRFRMEIKKLGLPQPDFGTAGNLEEALETADRIGYPLMVRPSGASDGRTTRIVLDEAMLRRFAAEDSNVSPEWPILIAEFLENAVECEADALCDGKEVFIPAVMEHIEYAGIHSGDSACVIPPAGISPERIRILEDHARRIALDLGVVGLINIQYAIANDMVYILQATPRASMTVPLVSKVCGIDMAGIAAGIMLGKKLAEYDLKRKSYSRFGVKEAVFPFDRFPEVDPVLGPEMRSTGEVLGLADNFGLAFYKSQEATGLSLPLEGAVLITVAERDKEGILEPARRFAELGFKLYATEGTRAFLSKNGVASEPVKKIKEGRPHIVDKIKNDEIQLVINTPMGNPSEADDSYIRKAAIKYKIPYITTTTAALAATKGILARKQSKAEVKSLQAYHAEIK
jgi:carbamoyl-phosphate synthase large subunit